ncbi:hypothetical protein [Paenibacillus durus]|uniref:Uncharacterized protein n=1 Tax=Paenibacillus durus TaxID=44251 RepID=A0A089HXZ8_PAEDU|nr:hypothetical protein [Paenibacillus durus]AIQ15263.1 hypothetical protein PDUR_27935 [Paenibacillus durus]
MAHNLTLSVFENKRLIYWDAPSPQDYDETFDQFYDESRDTYEEHRQRGVRTGFTIWKGGKHVD